MVTLLHRFNPRGGARQLMACRDPEVLLSGAAGTGKSRACLEKLYGLAMKYPGMRGLMVRKTLVSLTSTGQVTWRKFVIPEGEVAGHVRWFGGSRAQPAAYRFENGSEVVVAGLDDSQKVMSSEYDLIYVQEATELTLQDWENLTTRLRNGVMPYQQIISDCNPAQPTHWLKQRCDAGTTTMINTRHEDNPVYFDAKGQVTKAGTAYLKKLDNLTGVRYQRLRLGMWTQAEGVIYDGYDSTVHLVDRFPIPKDWQRFWAIDFGFTNPFVWQDWAVDPDGRLFLDREIYCTGRTVDQHAKQILRLVAPGGVWVEPRPTKIICDHDAEGRATFEKEVQQGTIAAHKAVAEGIQAVQGRLRLAGDGRPRVLFLRNATVELDSSLVDGHKPTGTVDEITGYVWDPAGKTPKEVPLKENDHGMDAMRYMVAHLDLKGSARIRFFDPGYGVRSRW